MFILLSFVLAYTLEDLQGVRVLATPDMGKGLFVKEKIDIGDKVLCVNESIAIHSDDANYLLEHVLELSDSERLKAFLLYHKFVLKEKSRTYEYLKYVGQNKEHPVYYSEETLRILAKVSGYFDLQGVRNLQEQYKVLVGILGGLSGMPKEMLKFESYLWASEIVMSRSFVSFNSETQDYSYIYIPFIDLANYWPVKKSVNPSNEIYFESGQYCLLTSAPLNPGDQVFIDYSFTDLSKFFTNFGFIIEKDPKLSINFHLSIDPCKNCTFPLKHYEVNWDLFQKIMQLTGSDYSPEINIRNFLPIIKDSYIYQDLISGLLIYRLELTKMKNSLNPGLRELKRNSIKESGENLKILKYSSAFRVLVYSHLESLERELINGFYIFLF